MLNLCLLMAAILDGGRGHQFLYASFVIYIGISMVELMWVRVNYKVMFIMVDR
jgi:hypothetical protein